MKLRVRPGPRPGWGRVDIEDDKYEYDIKGVGRLRPTRIGRFQTLCLVFPLRGLRVGDEVEVEEVLRCRGCGKQVATTINGLCDDCYLYVTLGDMVSPPLAGLLEAGRGR